MKIPTTYNITKGEKFSDETMTLSGTTGYPYHKAGFGAAQNMVTTVPDASAPVFSAQPIKPTGSVDENINIQSGLQINGKDEKDVKLSKGETFTLAGTLDTKPIQDVIKDKIGKYGVGDVLDKVDVNNLSLTMTSAIRLPEAVAWNQDASTVSFDGGVKDFKIVDAKLTSGTLLVTFNLTDTSSVHTLKDLVTIMENTPDSLKINIGGLSAVNGTGDAPQQIQATVTGTFNADALLPAEATTPGYYDIEYTFVDTACPAINVSVSDEVKMAALYRLYNSNTGEHFYTQSQHERDALVGYGWNDEGIGWKSPETSDYPVYRLYNPNAGDHHFTMDEHEKDVLVSVGWKYDGIAFYSLPENEGLRVYRACNPNAKAAGAYNYTLNKTEHDYLLHIGWIDEGTAWWASDNK